MMNKRGAGEDSTGLIIAIIIGVAILIGLGVALSGGFGGLFKGKSNIESSLVQTAATGCQVQGNNVADYCTQLKVISKKGDIYATCDYVQIAKLSGISTKCDYSSAGEGYLESLKQSCRSLANYPVTIYVGDKENKDIKNADGCASLISA